VLIAGVLTATMAGIASLGLHARLTSSWSDWDDHDAANVIARHLIEHSTGIDPQQGYVVLVRTDQPIDPRSAPPAEVQSTIKLLHRRPEVKHVIDYYSAAAPSLISKDARQTAVIARVSRIREHNVVPELEHQIRADPLLTQHVTLGGATIANTQGADVIVHDLTFAETVVFPMLFLLLFIVFRGVTAAAVALVGGASSILLALLAMRIILDFIPLSIYGLNLVFALGLGLSIDFSLLIISRYRQQLATDDQQAALHTAMSTAGRTVLFSGMTIASALLGLLTFPQPVLRSMGIAGILVTAAALTHALIILPAILACLGPRIESGAPARWQRRSGDPSAKRWRRLAETVIRRPAISAAVAALALIALAIPLLGVRFTSVLTPGTLPADETAGRVAQMLTHEFSAPISDEEQGVITAPATARPDVEGIAGQLRSVPGVADVDQPTLIDPNHWLIAITLSGEPLSDKADAAVQRIQHLSQPHPLSLTGPTADARALNASLGHHLPTAAAILILATLIVLFAMTRSVVLPLKAVLMNALSLGAALGSVVYVFQHSHLASLLGTSAQHALDSTSPIVLTAVGFGLSTDYGVFLLARIKENRDRGYDDHESITGGIEHTGRIVTSAAALLCLSMSALLLSRLTFVKELGFGAPP
jgi:uncharacterized membrane protein YdfJ with MMPL/SSD domain